jgi:L-ascorbate metabolism protein UlaG (beta-lactamase superfamily)
MRSKPSSAFPQSAPRRRPWSSCALIPAFLLLAGCGHVIYRAPNYGCKPFDFRKPPPCDPAGETAATSGEVVAIRYLGAGGLAIRWRGQILLTAPFFSNYGFPRVPFGRLSPQEEAIGEGMKNVPASEVGAILAGHSHYDHLGDLPIVAEHHAPRARLYVNDSGLKLLGHAFGNRVQSLERSLDAEIPLEDAEGQRLPFRVRTVASEHAPHFLRYHWAGGPVKHPWTQPWERLRLWHMRSGTTLAYVIDLLDDRGTARYRIYYQDAASGDHIGVPREDGRPYDLAILCIASHNWVEDAPQALLGRLRPRHVLVAHYENFFRRGWPRAFVPMLTNGLANRYLGRVEKSLRGLGRDPEGPVGRVCGPAGPEWTMPLVGEEVRFQPGSGVTSGCPSDPPRKRRSP